MSRTVFILGAGASREGGAPLMADFLDSAEAISGAGETGDVGESFDLVFRGIHALQGVYAKAQVDSDNLEAVFAAFEMAELFGGLGNLTGAQVGGLSSAIRAAIVRTLEARLRFTVVGESGNLRVEPPEPYENFAELVLRLKDVHSVSVITFNYDLGVDYGFSYLGGQISYCLGDSHATPGTIPLMKLHGSLNWTRCSVCSSIEPWPLKEFFSTNAWPLRTARVGQTMRLAMTGAIRSRKHCDNTVASEPVIVPPTWSKARYHAEISRVWRAAARHLAEAENIFVVGYSLPDTDQFFRYLYALGTVGETRLKRFWVFDPDPTGNVKARFETLLGPLARRRFDRKQEGFRMALRTLRSELNVPDD